MTNPASILSEFRDDYPLCYALGILVIVDGAPRVPHDKLAAAFTDEQLGKFHRHMIDKSSGTDGYYAWSVERFLNTIG